VKAILHTAYGPPEELQLMNVEKPTPKRDEILVKIHATTVSSSDCNIRNFTFTPKVFWLPMRIQFGLFKPKNRILGFDMAGVVQAVGREVTRFQVGDKIFGTAEPAMGTHAEYICLPEGSMLADMPANVSYEEVATLPVAGITALYFLRDLGGLQAGQKILINGASGAIGTFAVQLAKHFGAHVTAVCSTTNLDMVSALGADHVVDYTREDFTTMGETYDVLFDVVGKLSIARTEKCLKEGGTYLLTVPTVEALRKGGAVISKSAEPSLEQLVFLGELLKDGKLKPVIDRTYPLEEVPAAFRYVESGHKKGNVVISIVPETM
jgi:NADPH:quinone reductase-like Zn-dependent oxidoreductase